MNQNADVKSFLLTLLCRRSMTELCLWIQLPGNRLSITQFALLKLHFLGTFLLEEVQYCGAWMKLCCSEFIPDCVWQATRLARSMCTTEQILCVTIGMYCGCACQTQNGFVIWNLLQFLMTSNGNQIPDILILIPVPYPLGHVSSPVAQCVAQRAPMQQCIWWLVRAPCSS